MSRVARSLRSPLLRRRLPTTAPQAFHWSESLLRGGQQPKHVMTQSPSASTAHVPPPQPAGHGARRQLQLGVPPHPAGSVTHAGGGSGIHPVQPAGQKPASSSCGDGQVPGAVGYWQK